MKSQGFFCTTEEEQDPLAKEPTQEDSQLDYGSKSIYQVMAEGTTFVKSTQGTLLQEKGIEENQQSGQPTYTSLKAKVTFAKPKPKPTKTQAAATTQPNQSQGGLRVSQDIRRKELVLGKQLEASYGKNAIKMLKMMSKGSSKRFAEPDPKTIES